MLSKRYRRIALADMYRKEPSFHQSARRIHEGAQLFWDRLLANSKELVDLVLRICTDGVQVGPFSDNSRTWESKAKIVSVCFGAKTKLADEERQVRLFREVSLPVK
jgi:hypothetical protein